MGKHDRVGTNDTTTSFVSTTVVIKDRRGTLEASEQKEKDAKEENIGQSETNKSMEITTIKLNAGTDENDLNVQDLMESIHFSRTKSTQLKSNKNRLKLIGTQSEKINDAVSKKSKIKKKRNKSYAIKLSNDRKKRRVRSQSSNIPMVDTPLPAPLHQALSKEELSKSDDSMAMPPVLNEELSEKLSADFSKEIDDEIRVQIIKEEENKWDGSDHDEDEKGDIISP